MTKVSIHRSVKGTAIATALCLMGDSMLYVVLPLHYEEVGLTALWQIGVLLSANRLIRLPLSPFIAWVYEKFTIRTGMWAAVIIAILTTFAYGWVEGFLGLLLVRCIWGIGWALFRMAGYLTVVTQSEDGNRGEYMGAYNGLFRLGSLGGMLVGGILADMLGLKWVAIILAIAMLPALPMVAAWVPTVLTREAIQPGVQRIGYIGLFRQSGALLFLGILCTGIVMAMVYQGLYTSTISHLVGERMPQDWTFLGFAVGAATIAGALQALRWTWDPWLSPWIGRTIDGSSGRTPMLIGSLIAAAVLFMLVSTTLPFIVWLFLLIGIMITGTTMHTVVDSMMADRAALGSSARIITVYTIAVDVGASIGPTLAYVFMDTFQSSSVYMFSGFILLLVGALWFWRELRMKVSRRT